jgi:2-dehydro-3-deoxygluconokinase
LDPEYLGEAEYLHLTGITPALSDSCLEATWEALRIADEHDVAVSLDPNVRRKLWTEAEARSTLREMIPHVHVVLTGMGEATLLAGKQGPEVAARALHEMGPAQVVVRLGEDGALAVGEDGTVERRPAIDVKAVDVVGAGDAFTAGYLSGQLRGWDVAESLELGNVAGGLATTVAGDSEGNPTWEEAQPYLNEEEGATDVDR